MSHRRQPWHTTVRIGIPHYSLVHAPYKRTEWNFLIRVLYESFVFSTDTYVAVRVLMYDNTCYVLRPLTLTQAGYRKLC